MRLQDIILPQCSSSVVHHFLLGHNLDRICMNVRAVAEPVRYSLPYISHYTVIQRCNMLNFQVRCQSGEGFSLAFALMKQVEIFTILCMKVVKPAPSVLPFAQ